MTGRSQPPQSGAQRTESDRRILVVEDNQDVRETLWLTLLSHGWKVETADDGLAALQLLEESRFAAVLADEMIPGPPGDVVLERARVLNPSATLVLFSGWISQHARARARRIGAICVTKGATDSLALLLTVLEESHGAG